MEGGKQWNSELGIRNSESEKIEAEGIEVGKLRGCEGGWQGGKRAQS
jgi:hypothetical protein